MLEKEETNSRHAHVILQQVLKAQTDQATEVRGSKSELKAEIHRAKADATGDLADTTATCDEDKKYQCRPHTAV